MPRKLLLHQEHAALGAHVDESDGLEYVSRYRPVSEEYRSLAEEVGVSDLSLRGLIRIAGPEAALYLHGMVTNDVQGLKPGEGNRSTVIHARGRMLGECRVLRRSEEEIWIDLPGEAREAVVQHLDQFLISEDCELMDVTGRLVFFGAWGPKAPDLIEVVLGEPAPQLSKDHHRVFEVLGHEVLLLASAPYGVPGFELWTMEEGARDIWSRMVEVAKQLGGGPVGDEALEAMRISHGIPRWGKELGEDTIPLEANLQEAISYTKGCYVGQEVIAKATYRGAVRRKLCKLEVASGAKEGAALFDGETRVGQLTSVVDPHPAGGTPIALGYVRRDRLEAGKEFELDGGLTAKIVWAPEEEKK